MTNNFKSRTCSECLKHKFMAMKILCHSSIANYDFGFFLLYHRDEFSLRLFLAVWRMRWLFCTVKFFTWLKNFSRWFTHESFVNLLCHREEAHRKFSPDLNQISNLNLYICFSSRYEINFQNIWEKLSLW